VKHDLPHPRAGEAVLVASGLYHGSTLLIEDWWDRIAGKSWMDCNGNPACLQYAIVSSGDPIDDEVVYGKIGAFGVLVHVTRLASDEGAA
jgi:hypothetical protein